MSRRTCQVRVLYCRRVPSCEAVKRNSVPGGDTAPSSRMLTLELCITSNYVSHRHSFNVNNEQSRRTSILCMGSRVSKLTTASEPTEAADSRRLSQSSQRDTTGRVCGRCSRSNERVCLEIFVKLLALKSRVCAKDSWPQRQV